MKRPYKYMMVALIALMSAGCVTNEAQERSSRDLGTKIWHEVKSDINCINSIFRDIVHLDYMLSLDESEREAYITTYLPNLKGGNANGRYLLTTDTSYNTRYTTTFETHGKPLSDGAEWQVSSPSGIAYSLNIKPDTKGTKSYVATFEELNIAESTGEACFELTFHTDMEDNDKQLNEAVIEYSGTLTMIDCEASERRPLTLTTDIGHITYREYLGIVSGTLNIVCHDKLLETEDCVIVDVGYDPRRVIISCWGEQHTIYE